MLYRRIASPHTPNDISTTKVWVAGKVWSRKDKNGESLSLPNEMDNVLPEGSREKWMELRKKLL